MTNRQTGRLNSGHTTVWKYYQTGHFEVRNTAVEVVGGKSEERVEERIGISLQKEDRWHSPGSLRSSFHKSMDGAKS